MSNTVTALFQKRGVNFKTTVAQIVLIGNYAQDSETVVLKAQSMLNPGARSITGPNGSPAVPPRISATQLGGYQATLTPVANTPGSYILQFWVGITELAAEAYPAVILNGVLTVELDHEIGS